MADPPTITTMASSPRQAHASLARSVSPSMRITSPLKAISGSALARALTSGSNSALQQSSPASQGVALAAVPARRPITSDIDELLQLESALDPELSLSPTTKTQTTNAIAPEPGTPRGRVVSGLVTKLTRSATARGSSPAGGGAAGSSAMGLQAAAMGSANALYAKPDDAYSPDPNMPHLRHGRRNVDIGEILAETESTAANALGMAGNAAKRKSVAMAHINSSLVLSPPGGPTGAASPGEEPVGSLFSRTISVGASFRRWSVAGIALVKEPRRDPANNGTSQSKKSPPAGDPLSPSETQVSVRVNRSMVNLTGRTPGTQGYGTTISSSGPPALDAVEAARVRDLPLPAPMDIDALLSAYTRPRRAATAPSPHTQPPPPLSHQHHPIGPFSPTPSPHDVHSRMLSPSVQNMRVVSDTDLERRATNSLARPRSVSSKTDTTTDGNGGGVGGGQSSIGCSTGHGGHGAGHIPLSPSSVGQFVVRGSTDAVYTRGSDTVRGSQATSPVGSVSDGIATPLRQPEPLSAIHEAALSAVFTPEQGQAATAGTAAAATDRVSMHSVASETGSGGPEAMNAMLLILRTHPRPVLDRVYVNHINDIDALVTQSGSAGAGQHHNV
ncbi:hypothetical protein BC828DRAFT_384036 [Blastocladiella britannica]|nr:hypothetical protein BC828DRAFT_384036 [Blastocladiella britannica]